MVVLLFISNEGEAKGWNTNSPPAQSPARYQPL